MALSIINNVPNTECSEETGKYSLYTLTLQCADGYKISGDITVDYVDTYGFYQTKTMEVADDGKSATYSDYFNEKYDITLTGRTINENEPEPVLVNNISNSTAYAYYEDGVVRVEVTSTNKSKWRFYDTECLYTNTAGEESKADLNITVGDSGSTAIVTIADADIEQPITLNGTFGAVHLLTVNMTNADTLEDLPEFIKPNGVLECTVIANSGMEFERTPTFGWFDTKGQPVTKYFEVDDDNDLATCTLDTSLKVYDLSDDEGITLTVYTQAKEAIGGKYGSINVYKVTEDNLDEFALQRFFREKSSSEGIDTVFVDLGEYVNRLKRIHIDVPVASNDTLRCGNYDTGISVEAPATDRVTIDFGNVDIPSHNFNSVDFQSEVQLFLPFKGFVTVPSEYVGRTIRLEYIVNVVTGGAVAKVYCDGNCFLLADLEPSTNIIYRIASTDITLIGQDTWNEQLFYGIEPYVLIKWYASADTNNARNNDRVREVIGNQIGYIEADEVTLITNEQMLVTEQNDIYARLQSGVYIE